MSRGRTTAILLLVVVGGGCASPPDAAGGRSLVVEGVRVVDGTGTPPIPSATVVVVDGRIRYIGPPGGAVRPAGATVLDGTGMTALPGLADMHVHLVGGWDGYTTDMLGYQRYMNSLLYAGVTTVLDVGNSLPYVMQLKQEQRAGRLLGPRMYVAGPLIDGHPSIWPPISYTVTTADEVDRIVAQLADMGVDVLKAYSRLTPDLVDAVIAAGGRHGLPVVIDLAGPDAFDAAIRTGVAASAHMPPREPDQTMLDDLVRHGTSVITTLAVFESFDGARFGDLSFLDDPLIANTTPPWFLDDIRAHEPPGEAEGGEARTSAFRSALSSVRSLDDAGVPLIAGTDAPYPGVFQGEGIHRELELLVAAGLSPVRAVRAATFEAARFLGADSEWGSLQPGRVADMVLVDGDVSEDISASRAIRYVIVDGSIIDRSALVFDPERDPGFRTGAAVN